MFTDWGSNENGWREEDSLSTQTEKVHRAEVQKGAQITHKVSSIK